MTISYLLICTYPTCIFSFFLILKIRQELFCEIVKVQYRNSKIIWTRYVFSGALLIQLTQLKKFIMSLITGFRFPSNASRFWLVFQSQYYFLNPSSTGKSFSEALILASVNPQYDERSLISKKNKSSEYVVFISFFCFNIQNNTCSELVFFL